MTMMKTIKQDVRARRPLKRALIYVCSKCKTVVDVPDTTSGLPEEGSLCFVIHTTCDDC